MAVRACLMAGRRVRCNRPVIPRSSQATRQNVLHDSLRRWKTIQRHSFCQEVFITGIGKPRYGVALHVLPKLDITWGLVGYQPLPMTSKMAGQAFHVANFPPSGVRHGRPVLGSLAWRSAFRYQSGRVFRMALLSQPGLLHLAYSSVSQGRSLLAILKRIFWSPVWVMPYIDTS